MVRLDIASALQKLNDSDMLATAKQLARRAEDTSDAYIPKMIWFGLARLSESHQAELLQIATETKMHTLSQSIFWYLSRNKAGRRALTELLIKTPTNDCDGILSAMRYALKKQGLVRAPAGWSGVHKRLSASGSKTSQKYLAELAANFGSETAIANFHKTLADKGSAMKARVSALKALNQVSDKTAAAHYLNVVHESPLRQEALLALGRFDGDAVGRKLLELMKTVDYTEQIQIANTLSASPAFALVLAEAVQNGTIDKKKKILSALQIRQMYNLKQPELTTMLKSIWGEINETNAAREVEMAKYRRHLADAPSWSPRPNVGKATFQRLCASCHTLSGKGGNIGPDLTGSGKNGIEYFIESIVAPNSVIGLEYQLNVITKNDGSILSGTVTDNNNALTVRGPSGDVIIQKSEIKSRQVMKQSMMPAGLMRDLEPHEVVDLLRFLTKQ